MNVCYCCDSRGYPGLEASIYSLLTHTKGVNIYILSMNYERPSKEEGPTVLEGYPAISYEQYNKIKQIVQYLDPKQSRVCLIDMYDLYIDLFAQGCDENDGHSSPYSTLKLCFDKILPYIDDILYLDCDTIIQEDLNPMYYDYLNKMRQQKKNYAGYHIELNDRGDTELVASVLLFDLVGCRNTNFFERVRYNVTHNFYKWYEQSALEDTEDCYRIAETYNYMQLYEERTYEPAILHFADKLNPKIYFTTPKIFYNKYPHLKYIQKGIELIGTLNLKCK